MTSEILDPEQPLERHDVRLIGRLARQPGWFDGLPVGIRRTIVAKLASRMAQADTMTVRDLTRLASTLAAFERNDIARAQLMTKVMVDGEEDPELRSAVQNGGDAIEGPPQAPPRPNRSRDRSRRRDRR